MDRATTPETPRRIAWLRWAPGLLTLRQYQAAGLIDDVVAAVDIERLAGDEPRRVVGKECGSGSDIVDANEAARRRFGLCLVEQRIEFGDAGRRTRRQRTRRDGVDADTLWAELGCD